MIERNVSDWEFGRFGRVGGTDQRPLSVDGQTLANNGWAVEGDFSDLREIRVSDGNQPFRTVEITPIRVTADGVTVTILMPRNGEISY